MFLIVHSSVEPNFKPAVNRQPGYRRGTRRAENMLKNHKNERKYNKHKNRRKSYKLNGKVSHNKMIHQIVAYIHIDMKLGIR